jgi:hypothetical protein
MSLVERASVRAFSVVAVSMLLGASPRGSQSDWRRDFRLDPADAVSSGRNRFFPLEPGYRLEFADGGQRLVVTVLPDTLTIAGIVTRVVEERETHGGALVEVSRNFFAMSRRTNDVYYFGEDVDIYKNGKVVSHEGAWRAGRAGARFGLMMPGEPKVGMRFYQELAEGVAMDRAEIASLDDSLRTPAGSFTKVLRIRETTPLEPGHRDVKRFAAGIGLVEDGSMRLVRYGKTP